MKLLPLELAGMLEFGGYIQPGDDEDDRAMCKIAYFCDLINAYVERSEPVPTPTAGSET